jgi:hypothetical protein
MDPSKPAITPTLTPPPGVMPDFVNYHSLLPWIVATASICMVLTAAVLALRMFTRMAVIKSVDWADCLSSRAMILWMGELIVGRQRPSWLRKLLF